MLFLSCLSSYRRTSASCSLIGPNSAARRSRQCFHTEANDVKINLASKAILIPHPRLLVHRDCKSTHLLPVHAPLNLDFADPEVMVEAEEQDVSLTAA
jgi:hypothetical protein